MTGSGDSVTCFLRSLCALVALVFAASTSTAQSISVDTLPAYGTLGFITGTVTGVDPSTHQVAVYIQIEGSGWWTKLKIPAPTEPFGEAGISGVCPWARGSTS